MEIGHSDGTILIFNACTYFSRYVRIVKKKKDCEKKHKNNSSSKSSMNSMYEDMNVIHFNFTEVLKLFFLSK